MNWPGHVRAWFLMAALSFCPLGHAQQPEFRALWADTFHAGMRNAAEVTALVSTARNRNFNAIIVEARKRGDAYYNSTIEPTATDVAAGFDPLADLITKAHTGGRRIEVHAWITTYLIWNNQTTPPTQPDHPYNLHPEWLSQHTNGTTWDGGNYQFEQSHPEVQKHVYNVAMDIITRYDVDGFHFDYVRFSGNMWGYHPVAVDRFNRRFNRTGKPAHTDPAWLQFRRDQVSGLVRKVYLNAIAARPEVKLSAATICFAPGVANDAQWFGTAAAWNNVLQDWRGWMQEGILDLNVPMMYFDQRRWSNAWADWSIFAKERTYGRHVALGQGSYLNTASNMIYQLRTTRTPSPNSNAVPSGLAVYSYAVPVTNDTTPATLYSALVSPSAYDPNPVPIFVDPVDPPEMIWKTAPTVGHLKGTIRSGVSNVELDGAVVQIVGPLSAARTNDATGFYGFAHLPPGNYTVSVSYSNHLGASAGVTIVAGTVSTLDFALLPPDAPLLPDARPGLTEAMVTWKTALPADAQVRFGLTPVPDGSWKTSWREPGPATNHSVLLAGLKPGTNYYYQAQSRVGTNVLVSTVRSFATAGDIIMDNADPGVTLSGTWTPGTSSPDKFGANYVFATAGSGATATYRPLIQTPGLYDVYVWYPQGGNRPTNAPFAIAFDSGTNTGIVNQTSDGGGWRLVASSLPFSRGTNGSFQWRTIGAEAAKVIMADGVRFSYVTNQEPPAPGAVPRWWNEFFFGSSSDASLDPDGDGFTTAREYLAGTDPTRASSQLRFWIAEQTSNELRLAFAPFHPGRSNELQYAAILATNGWSIADAQPPVATNSSGVFTLTNIYAPQKFYRLKVEVLP